jgi:hypothetical protein
MATVAIDDVLVQDADKYLTRSKTANSTTTGDKYTYPVTQNWVSLFNNGAYDLLVSIGKHTNTIIHPKDTFEAFVDFDEFEIKSFGGVSQFIVKSKELGTTPIDDITDLWKYLAERDKADEGDIVFTATNKTSSAATINAAITGEAKKAEVEYTVTLKNAAGNKTHAWYNGNLIPTVAKTSTAGVVALAADYITFVDGVGKIKVIMTGTWAKDDVVTLKLNGNIMGFALTEKSVTDTLVA